MKKLKMIALVAAMSVVPACAADTKVQGESLDNGLGQLSADYTGWEFMPAGRLLGESLDSGLGELASDYTGWEFMPAGRLLGESLDSGLGSLTREDLEPYMQKRAVVRTARGR